MRACWLKLVGWDWSISADYIWLIFSDANTIEALCKLDPVFREIAYSRVHL